MIHSGKATVIVGGQFGSEAKGLVAAWVALRFGRKGLVCTTNAGAQAGHTTVLADGTSFVCYHLPTIGVMVPGSLIYLNAGSIIDPVLLDKEIQGVAAITGEAEDSLRARVHIDPAAAIIHDDDKTREAGGEGTTHLASTGKGVGAALSNKIMRQKYSVAGDYMIAGIAPNRIDLVSAMRELHTPVTVEIPQGTGLSINSSGFFPYTTSRECWVGQGMVDAGIPYHYLGHVIMVCRTFPIRVGNTDKGTSGDWYEGSEELEWSDFPGVTPERTTVTKRIRRIATWSRDQYRRSLRLNRPNTVVLTFVNYLKHPRHFYKHVSDMREDERAEGISVNHLYSWGPRVDQCSYQSDEAARHTMHGAQL